ncbi:MAG: hypothetical protein HDQ91_07230 [Desulfovibrio sp.]|nr:hypothetical protein [Desulfovibrio sp.]
MKTGTKVTLAFLGGAVAGAAVLAYLNRDKLDWDGIRPAAADLLDKGEKLKETLLAKFEALKEELSKDVEKKDEVLEDRDA